MRTKPTIFEDLQIGDIFRIPATGYPMEIYCVIKIAPNGRGVTLDTKNHVRTNRSKQEIDEWLCNGYLVWPEPEEDDYTELFQESSLDWRTAEDIRTIMAPGITYVAKTIVGYLYIVRHMNLTAISDPQGRDIPLSIIKKIVQKEDFERQVN